MLQDKQGDDDLGKSNKENDDDSQAGWWWIIVVALILLGVVTLVGFTLIERKDRVNFVTVNALSVLIFITIAMQVYVYRKQWKAMREQLGAMNEQASLMQKSLDLGERQADMAQEGMIRTLRAYVGVISGEGAGNQFRVLIENTGTTPARNVAVRYVLGQGYNAPPLADADADDFIYVGLLATGKQFGLEMRGPDLAPEINQLMGSNPNFRLWCVGDVTYVDVFGSMRETEFCLYRVYGNTKLHPWPMGGYELTQEAEAAD